MSRRGSIAAAVSQRRAERRRHSRRFVDLRLDVIEQRVSRRKRKGAKRTQNRTWVSDGEVALCAGGRWDRRRRRWVGEGEKCSEVRVHPRQVEVIDFFAEWLDKHLAGVDIPDDERIFSVLLHGGQRGGKTYLGVSVCAPVYAIARPRSFVWVVCPTANDFEEVEVALEQTMPKSWYRKRVKKTVVIYFLANGSRIVLRSADNPESLKKGRCDLIIMNECQQMSAIAFGICRARIADKGGLVIGCANPPKKPIGEWVMDWVVEAQAGLRPNTLEFYLSPFDNPHILHVALSSLAREIDEKSYQVDVLGYMLSVGDTVLYNWNRLENELAPKLIAAKLFGVDELRDITRQVTARLEGRPYDHVLSVDLQRRPVVSVEGRFYENPLAPIDAGGDDWWKYCLVVFTSEVVIELGQEEDLVVAWRERGYNPEQTLIVCDASGKWQFIGIRDPLKIKEKREQVKGRGSWDVFRKAGYRHLRNPDPDLDKNPDIVERCRVTTSRIKTADPGPYGQRYVFADPSSCRTTCKAIRSWPNNKRGQPSRDSSHAHVGDCVTYFVHRFFSRRTPAAKVPEVKLIARPVASDGLRGQW